LSARWNSSKRLKPIEASGGFGTRSTSTTLADASSASLKYRGKRTKPSEATGRASFAWDRNVCSIHAIRRG
jgi:hypothetical protein